jgi:hypothetical protein
MPYEICSERLILADAASKAAQAVYDAQNVRQMVVLGPDNSQDDILLTQAKATERNAVAALRKHRKEHGC